MIGSLSTTAGLLAVFLFNEPIFLDSPKVKLDLKIKLFGIVGTARVTGQLPLQSSNKQHENTKVRKMAIKQLYMAEWLRMIR